MHDHPRVESVNVSPIIELEREGRHWRTGIFKTPVPGPIRTTREGLVGDAQANRQVHGGPHRAVYAYPIEHYDHWAHTTHRDDWSPGTVGENLTIRGFDETQVCIGDVLRIARARLQVTQPRGPCATLAMRVESPTFPRLMSESGRLGFYMRVLEEGDVWAGAAIEIESRDPARLDVRRCYRLRYFEKDDAEGVALASTVRAMEPTWRAWFANRLADLRAQGNPA